MSKPDVVLKCRKCGHLLFIRKWKFNKKLEEYLEMDCPECGEEGYENWILSRLGDYDVEYGGKDE